MRRSIVSRLNSFLNPSCQVLYPKADIENFLWKICSILADDKTDEEPFASSKWKLLQYRTFPIGFSVNTAEKSVSFEYAVMSDRFRQNLSFADLKEKFCLDLAPHAFLFS